MIKPTSNVGQWEGELGGRLYQLDGLRAFAFLAVFLSHTFQIPLLWAGVDLFFVLSGFLITGILLSQRGSSRYFRVFYYRRFLRIFPPYYLILVLTFIFFHPNWRSDWYWYVFYISNVHEAFHWAESYSGLAPMWSLAGEEQFYLLWPVLIYLLGERGMWRLAIVLLFAAPGVRLFCTLVTDDYRVVYNLLPCRVDTLAAGALLAISLRHSPARFERFARFAPLLSLGCGVMFIILILALPNFRTASHSISFNVLGYTLVGGVMVGIVAYLIPRRKNWLHRFLSSTPLVYLGTISYMMYLCHAVIIDQIHLLNLSIIPRAVFSLAIIVLFSSLSWHILEKPLQGLKDRINVGATPKGSPAVERSDSVPQLNELEALTDTMQSAPSPQSIH